MPLTNNDLNKIRELFDAGFEKRLRVILSYTDKSQTQIISEFENKIKHLPTKDEFYAREDELMGELKAIREELPL